MKTLTIIICTIISMFCATIISSAQDDDTLPGNINQKIDWYNFDTSLAEKAVFIQTNIEREKDTNGVVFYDEDMAKEAREHSNSMSKYDFVGHLKNTDGEGMRRVNDMISFEIVMGIEIKFSPRYKDGIEIETYQKLGSWIVKNILEYQYEGFILLNPASQSVGVGISILIIKNVVKIKLTQSFQ